MIQPEHESHLNDILDIERRVFSKPWTRKQLQNDLVLGANSENWVYMEDQQVAGYILEWKVMDEFHLNNIAVHSDFQRRHIGRSLIEHVKNHLQSQNIQRIYLEVSEKNKSTQRKQCIKSIFRPIPLFMQGVPRFENKIRLFCKQV